MAPNTSKLKPGYKEIEWEEWYNTDDPDLHPICVNIYKVIKSNFNLLYPKSRFEEHIEDFIPPYEEMVNYGLPPEKQFFVREEYPVELKKLEAMCDTTDDIWAALESPKYRQEREWIAKQWHYRLHGKWYFINGKATYLDGWAWMYNNYWKIDVGIPEYRNRDRRFFLFNRFAYTTTEAYFKYRIIENGTLKLTYSNDMKEYGMAASQPDHFTSGDDGYYIDVKRRTCYGTLYPKHRREGATSRCQCINYEIGTRFLMSETGVQSNTGDNSESIFRTKLVPSSKFVPFFFVPMQKSSSDPAMKMAWGNPKIHAKGRNIIQKNPGLMSIMSRATTADRGFYDGKKLRFLHEDEIGKTIEEDVYMRHSVTKHCLSTGNGRDIIGFTVKTSTVGEMSRAGGYNFWRLCQESHYDRVSDQKTGQTVSGLYILFMPAYDGLEGFVDDYGNSIIDTPEKPIVLRNGKIIDIGAREYLQIKLDAKLAAGDNDGYNEELRLHPTRFAHCFVSSAQDVGFNVRVINERISELMFSPDEAAKPHSLEWVDKFRTVKAIPNENGKFFISKHPDAPNKMYNQNGMWFPEWDKITISSADAFRFEKARTTGRKLSNGGGATFLGRDTTIDPDDKPIEKWQTHRFVCTYNYREHNKETYAEDMLKMCIYFNSMMYPEYNVPVVAEHFDEWGFGGYLLYDVDVNTGKRKVTPGFNTNGPNIKPLLFGDMKQYMELHAKRERHMDMLTECITIGGLEDMTNHDLFTAGAGCLYGSNRKSYKILQEYQETSIDVSDAIFYF